MTDLSFQCFVRIYILHGNTVREIKAKMIIENGCKGLASIVKLLEALNYVNFIKSAIYVETFIHNM